MRAVTRQPALGTRAVFLPVRPVVLACYLEEWDGGENIVNLTAMSVLEVLLAEKGGTVTATCL